MVKLAPQVKANQVEMIGAHMPLRRKVVVGNGQEGPAGTTGFAWHIEVFEMEMQVVREGQKVTYIDFKLQYITCYFT